MWTFGDFGGPRGRGPQGRHGWESGPHGGGSGAKRARRGNVRAAILSLLNEQPMHGYQMIQELSRRSGGRWNPSPGSIYPRLQMLEDEGLVKSRQSEDGKRLFELTDAGRSEAAGATSGSGHKPWEHHGEHHSGPPRDLVMAIGDAASTLLSAASQGNDEQRAQIVQLLSEFRQTLSAIVPEASSASPFGGRRRGPWARSGPGWTFGVPDWIFGGPGPFGGRDGGEQAGFGRNWGPWASTDDPAQSAASGGVDHEGEDEDDLDEADELDFEA